MNGLHLLKGIILFLAGILLLLFTSYIYKSEKKEDILNQYQSAKIIGSFAFAIIMILLGLNEIFIDINFFGLGL